MSDVTYFNLGLSLPPPLTQYSDEDETNCVTQGDKLRALKSRRQAKAATASPLT